MKPQETFRKFFRASLLNPKAIIFGVAIFNVIWSWQFIHVPYSRQKYMTPLIFISALGLLLNKSWSNLLAAILAGHFVVEFVVFFFGTSAEVKVTWFSAEHLGLIANTDKVFQLSIVLSTIILYRASSAIMRAVHSHTSL